MKFLREIPWYIRLIFLVMFLAAISMPFLLVRKLDEIGHSEQWCIDHGYKSKTITRDSFVFCFDDQRRMILPEVE